MSTSETVGGAMAPAIDQDVLQYIKDLAIADPVAAFPRSRSLSAVAEDVEQSFINDKSIVSFVSGVSSQARKDILNATLLAQLAAKKKYPDDLQVLEWYREFINVLTTIGWNVQGSEISVFKTKGDIFEVENAIIDILTTAFGGNALAIIQKTLDSIKAMSDDEGTLSVFERNTHSISKGAFQLALAVENNGAVAMHLGTFLLTSSSRIKKILFFKSSKEETKLEYASKTATLNEEVYAGVRQAIADKLGARISDYIAEIDID